MRQLLATLGFMPASPGRAPRQGETRIDAIRREMLDALGWPVPRGCEALELRIRHALDAERLWYLRGELMHALAFKHGEMPATAQLSRISAMFSGVLPAGLASSHRPR